MKWSRHALILAVVLVCLLAGVADAAGLLLPRDGGDPIRLRSQRVTAVVEDGIARTTVRQTFLSGRSDAVEAIYTFPVPEGAALVDVAMETGGQRYEGLLAERQVARRTYDSLVRRKIDPAIVEQVGRDTFRLSVYPVLPAQETVVEITWIQTCPLVNGEMRYLYPLALAGDAAMTEQDFTFTLAMRSAATIVACESSTPGVTPRMSGLREVRASFEKTGAKLDRDIAVTARIAVSEASLGVKTFRGAKGDGYFAAVVTPPAVDDSQILARDITLVMDVSGSMQGEKFEQARASALYLLDRLRTRDAVNVILFSDTLRRFADAPVDATPENIAKLREFVAAASADGGTALGDALRAASEMKAREGRVAMAVVLTDGLPTVGITDKDEICGFGKAATANGVRMFTFGIGTDVDAALLDGVALAGRGVSEVFRAGGETESRLRSFLTRTASPVLANLKVTIDGRAADDLYPRPVADVFLGEQAVLTGRIAPGKHEIVVSGIAAGREVVLRATADVPESGGTAAVRDLYARQKLAYLEQAIRLRSGLSDAAFFATLDRGTYSTSDELVKAVIDLSLETGVQSPYTAFLVMLPEDRARIDPRDAAALDAAAERAKAKRRETAGLPPAEPKTAAAPRDAAAAERPPEVADATPVEESERVVEDAVVMDARTEDHNETAFDRHGNEDSGDPRFISDAPFDGAGENGTISVGGGAGASFGSRKGGRRSLKAGGGGKKSPSAVDRSLAWLKARQHVDGGWGEGVVSDPESTGLALLCFLGAGETHQTGAFKDQVKAGLKYLRAVQDADGCFGSRVAPDFHRAHLVAALAMVEAYGMTASVLWRESAQRGVTFVHATQNPSLGWGPGIRDGRNDTVLTAWAVLLLRASHLSGLEFDRTAVPGALKALELATDPVTGLVAAGPVAAGAEHTADLRSTAAAAAARIFGLATVADPGSSLTESTVLRQVEFLSTHRPSGDPASAESAAEYVYWASIGAYQAGRAEWQAWSQALEVVASAQLQDGAAEIAGTWDPLPGESRLRTTALRTLTLEVYYRYGRIFTVR